VVFPRYLAKTHPRFEREKKLSIITCGQSINLRF
jgi:hypothetical protein